VLSLKEMGNVRRHARVRLGDACWCLGELWNGLDFHVRSLLGSARSRAWGHAYAWMLLLAVALLVGGAGRAQAQGPNQVAIVVQYGAGDVSTYCVSFDSPTISGLDALRQAGVKVVYEGGALGARVCKIGPIGCDLPGNCFCQCKGTECLYWSYWHLVDGAWQYAIVGAASYQVTPGSVEGWSWGIGTPSQAPQPPPITFAEVCSPGSATPASSATPVSTATPAETPTLAPTSGEQPTLTPATATPAPTTTPSPTQAATGTATPAAAGGQPSSPTPVEPTVTRPVPTPTSGATRMPTSNPTGTHTPAVPANSAPAYTNYVFFGIIVLVLVALGAYVLLRRR
jgi:hypothetical protein